MEGRSLYNFSLVMYGDFKWECTEKDEPKGTQTTLFLVTAVLDIAAKHAVHDRTDS